MKSSRNTARQLFGLTLTLVGLLSWNTLPIPHPKLAVRAANRAKVAEPTGQPVSRAMANGRIAFVRDEGNGWPDIYTMNPDSSNVQRLTNSNLAHYYFDPAWSPDGTKIAFVRFSGTYNGSYYTDIVYEIFVMNADGSDQRRLTQSRSDYSPTWSPDGTKIAFMRIGSITSGGIFVMNADGSDQRAVASTSNLWQPAWSPDGLKFAVTDFYGIYLINVDGSNRTQITQPTDLNWDADYEPAWSPDGSKITFTRGTSCFGGCETEHLWVVNADGSNPTKLTDILAATSAWSPDGTKIIFGSQRGDLFVINPDGSGLTNITNTDGKHEWSPSWQPLPLTLPNPIDDPQFFVRQHYLDFLGREPDTIGIQNWVNTIVNCPNGGYGEFDNPGCDRVHVSAGFYLSEEFRGRGYWAYRFYQTSLGRAPLYTEFIPDMLKVGGEQSPQQEATSKQVFTDEWVNRAEFKLKYDALTNPVDYVDELLRTSGVTLSNRDALVSSLQSGQKTRAQVLREIVESKTVEDKFFIEGFVSMQYFGYLRRDPDTIGYNNWVQTLRDDPSNFRHMIFGFIYSVEYRERFGKP